MAESAGPRNSQKHNRADAEEGTLKGLDVPPAHVIRNSASFIRVPGDKQNVIVPLAESEARPQAPPSPCPTRELP